MSRAMRANVAIVCGVRFLASCAQAASGLMLIPAAAIAAAGTAVALPRRKTRRLTLVRLSTSLMFVSPFVAYVFDSSAAASVALLQQCDDAGTNRRIGLAVHHDCARDQLLWVCQPSVQMCLIPDECGVRKPGRIMKAWHSAGLAQEHSGKVRALPRWRVGFHGMAGATWADEHVHCRWRCRLRYLERQLRPRRRGGPRNEKQAHDGPTRHFASLPGRSCAAREG